MDLIKDIMKSYLFATTLTVRRTLKEAIALRIRYKLFVHEKRFYGYVCFQVEMLRERSKSYLGMHVILGGAILGTSLAILGLLINFTHMYSPVQDYTFLSFSQVSFF